ncbi:unnamed protein product [Parnassius apollo]|uniref:(apollo) hypothetical protein n=1 Tax=Parnassius apollo TaxID=110799 RepID=A0A8S3Y769_PARAO|nr:unnamed protein product [Parnassius apollo]
MNSTRTMVLLLALAAYTYAAPATHSTEETEKTSLTDAVPLVEYIETVDVIPGLAYVHPPTAAATEETSHKVARRSAFVEYPSNDLILSNFDESKNAESGVVGRIKVLPTWVG